jgi:predicted NAD/FAD-binding protein
MTVIDIGGKAMDGGLSFSVRLCAGGFENAGRPPSLFALQRYWLGEYWTIS